MPTHAGSFAAKGRRSVRMRRQEERTFTPGGFAGEEKRGNWDGHYRQRWGEATGGSWFLRVQET